jgi:branched-chain amino acid transport system substrate-binding protein
MKLSSVALTAALVLTCGTAGWAAEPFRIGVLTDESGNFSALSGHGSVIAAEMAAADFGGKVLGRPIQVLEADHQNKTDIGLEIARRWFEVEHVSVIADVPNSAIALGVQEISRQVKRIVLYSSAGTADLTGKACSPYGVQWTWDTYEAAVAPVRALAQEGADRWFFITADFAFGAAMQRDAEKAIATAGGKVVGAVKHPLNTHDFASFLLQAQGSNANAVVFANGGADTANAIKQSAEFGLSSKDVKLAALALNITDVDAIGLKDAHGFSYVEGFYWDLNDQTRAWSKRFFARQQAMPTQMQAGTYSAVMHYLKAVAAAGTDDADKVMERMRAMPVDDFFSKDGKVRADGRMVHDVYLVRVKSPAESKYPWDYYQVARRIPGDEAFRPLSESGCPLVK